MSKTLKQQLSKISPLSIGLVLAFATVMTYALVLAFAAKGTATVYTTPGGTQSISKDSNFTVNVRISTGSNVSVTAASLYIAYPVDKLAVQGVSFSGSPYSLDVAQTNSGGILRLDRAALPVISGGDKLFAKVTFKAVANGSANISFGGSSYVLSGDDDSNLPLQKSGVTYNISTPSSSGSSSQTTSKPSSTGSTPKSSGGQTSLDDNSSASGSSTASPDQTVDSKAGSEGENASKQSNSSSRESNDNSRLQILVVDRDQNPIKNAEVTVNGKKAKTDENGIVWFDNVPIGDYEIVVSHKGKKTFGNAQVKGESTSKPESFTVEVDDNKLNPLVWILVPTIGMLIAAGLFFGRPWAKEHIGFFNKQTTGFPKKPADDIKLPIAPNNSPPPGSTYAPGNQGAGQVIAPVDNQGVVIQKTAQPGVQQQSPPVPPKPEQP